MYNWNVHSCTGESLGKTNTAVSSELLTVHWEVVGKWEFRPQHGDKLAHPSAVFFLNSATLTGFFD